jgi:hypothetical protein
MQLLLAIKVRRCAWLFSGSQRSDRSSHQLRSSIQCPYVAGYAAQRGVDGNQVARPAALPRQEITHTAVLCWVGCW